MRKRTEPVADRSEQYFLDQVKIHAGILHKVARMYTDHAADREDLQQEILIQLWKSYQSFRGDSQFSTWMYRVAINTAITFIKKNKFYNIPVDAATISHQPDEDAHQQQARLDAFYKAVRELNPIERALLFYFMEGLSHKETGLQLGISEVNARVKLNRTKEKLQTIIKKQGYEF